MGRRRQSAVEREATERETAKRQLAVGELAISQRLGSDEIATRLGVEQSVVRDDLRRMGIADAAAARRAQQKAREQEERNVARRAERARAAAQRRTERARAAAQRRTERARAAAQRQAAREQAEREEKARKALAHANAARQLSTQPGKQSRRCPHGKKLGLDKWRRPYCHTCYLATDDDLSEHPCHCGCGVMIKRRTQRARRAHPDRRVA